MPVSTAMSLEIRSGLDIMFRNSRRELHHPRSSLLCICSQGLRQRPPAWPSDDGEVRDTSYVRRLRLRALDPVGFI